MDQYCKSLSKQANVAFKTEKFSRTLESKFTIHLFLIIFGYEQKIAICFLNLSNY